MTSTYTEPLGVLLERPSQTWAKRVRNRDLPYWLRVAAYAEANDRGNGHCPLVPEELHNAIDSYSDKATISRAIAQAVHYGFLHPASGARCLILARATLDADCPATHRAKP